MKTEDFFAFMCVFVTPVYLYLHGFKDLFSTTSVRFPLRVNFILTNMNYLNRPLSLLCVVLGLYAPSVTMAQNAGKSAQDLLSGLYENDINYERFKVPAKQYMGHAWFTFQLANLTDASVKEMVRKAVESNAYGGYMITPDRGRMPQGATAPNATYLDKESFRLYRVTIEEGLKQGLPMDILYDELQFPTGMAGGLFAKAYPEDVQKSLEKSETDVVGPLKAELSIPEKNSIYIGTTLMNLETLECVDVSDKVVRDGVVFKVPVPKGSWKVMVFYLDASLRRGVCDYLSEKAIAGLIDVMYDTYYENLKEYFGTMIKQLFFDEPSMHNSVSGRHWTPGFNEGFQKKYGYSPMKYYPALWYDIGSETAAARNALHAYRTELYTENFIGQIARWCAERGVALSGHMDQEEAPNPVGTLGDLMKIFKHEQIPTIDDIWFTGRSNTAYKVVTSAAFNYDRPVILAETYAAYQRKWQTVEAAWRTAMDQHAMGINQQVGWRPSAAESPEIGQFIGRTEYLLRGGRHVADVAMLYPITTMQAKYKFAHPVGVEPATGGPARGVDAGFYFALEGGIPTPEMSYMEMGEMLFRGMQIDFTYLHPEILQEKCLIDGNQLTLDNQLNRESFKVLVLPGCEVISLQTALKVKEFFQAGGTVIATTVLPKYASEFGKDREVQKIIGEIFGIPEYAPMKAAIRAYTDDFKTYFAYRNDAGGKSYFLPRPDPKMVTDVLNESLKVRDVKIQMEPVWPVKLNMAYDGAVTYIHKVKGGKDIYYIVNSTNQPIETSVSFRGSKSLAMWDPHTGERQSVTATATETAGQAVTTAPLSLGALKSVFYITQ